MSTQPNINDILNPQLKNDILGLNQVIRDDLSSNIFLINQISEYIINSGGKRIRPLLLILSARILNYQGDNKLLYKMAAMIEYIHTATLLHDDVVDESGLRRGRKTANAVFGNAASVLVGDFIYTRSFQLMIESKSIELLTVMANSTNKISEGEVLQLLNIGNTNLDETDYFKVIHAKTSVLFESSAHIGAIISNANESDTKALINYAVNLGIAFQIIDDVLDYIGDVSVLGKNLGDDLLEGKVTLPLIYILQYGTKSQIKLVKNSIKSPKDANIENIIDSIHNTNSIEYCKNKASYYIQMAIDSLDIFNQSETKDIMIKIAQISINRIS
jgi:octaprenyl-diphosphate synthase